MEGAGPQERVTVRCTAPDMIKSESSSDMGKKGHADRIRHSCNSTPLMELGRNHTSSDNDPGDRTNERLAATSDGTLNSFNAIENKQCKNPNYSVDMYNANGLDSKTSKIKQIVEDAISPDSKQAVMRILDQVNELSTAEKLLLYLKLPTGRSGKVDPLRQPLNPLGSRFEIHQTITWIKTHLEEDPDVSLPKQDVYDEYIAYCNNNAMKPLSTADFGKVMKQVFPCVRPRRLGTRGNSRYCYAGMRKRIKLEAPVLPDLGEESKLNSGSCSEDELLSAASCLICEWAQKLLGVTFKSLHDLACYLVENLCVDSRSVAAFTILSASSGNKVIPSLTPSKLCGRKVSGTSSLGIQVAPPGGMASKHRETQLQLQRKLQEREVIREQKRKLQEQQTAALTKRNHLPSISEKGKGKRAKLSPKETSHGSTNTATQGNCSEDGPICDKGQSKAGRGRGKRNCRTKQGGGKLTPGMLSGNTVQENGTSKDTVADHKTAFKPSYYCNAIVNTLEVEGSSIMNSSSDEVASLKRSHSANCVDDAVTSASCHLNTTSTNKPPTSFSPVQELNNSAAKRPSTQSVSEGGKQLVNSIAKLESSPTSKLPIPRLNTPIKQLTNVIIFPPILQQKLTKKKYKLIQPKPEDMGNMKRDGGDIEEGSIKHTEKTSAVAVLPAGDTKKELSSVSIGCPEKDTLDDYLHGGNNSQEQEEELMRYFQHQNSSSSNEEPEDGTQREAPVTYPSTTESSKSDKLSQLRLLLERNLNQAPGVVRDGPFNPTGGRSAPLSSAETPSSSLSVEDFTDPSPGNGDVFLPNSTAGNLIVTAGPASASLSLLSQRCQNRTAGKPALLLPSLLTNGGPHTSLGSRRRVSFETSVVEHYQDGMHQATASVPPSPNTRRRIFSFTPISPGPHSPLSTHRASSKPSSANASPFVSPHNTPVPRSRHNSGQTVLNQGVSYLATPQMQNGGNGSALGRTRHSTMAAKVVRSNSVNSQSSSLPHYQAPRPRAMSITTPMLQAVRHNSLPGHTNGHCDTASSNTFAVPGELHLPVLQAGSHQTMLNASAPPMSPLSISAPQSPMIPFQQSGSSASNLLTVPSTNHAHFSSTPQSLLQEVLQGAKAHNYRQETFVTAEHKMETQDTSLPDTSGVASQVASLPVNVVDPLAQEVSQFFPDDQHITSVLTGSVGFQSSSHRSQSVPLHRMTSASQQQESPLYIDHSTIAFNFSHFTSSATSSVAPTPVPSEFTDFVSAGDSSTAASTDLLMTNGEDGADAETTELNSENLNRIFNLLDDVQQKEEQLMPTLDVGAAQQHNQKFLFQPSRSYPNTPLPYQSTSNTRDPVVGSFATSLPSVSCATTFTSRSYPSTPLLGRPIFGGSEDDGTFQQGLEDINSGGSVHQLTLNALNIRTAAPPFAVRRNINPLLEQSSFSVEEELALDTLDALQECDSLAQFVQEVSNPVSDTSI